MAFNVELKDLINLMVRIRDKPRRTMTSPHYSQSVRLGLRLHMYRPVMTTRYTGFLKFVQFSGNHLFIG